MRRRCVSANRGGPRMRATWCAFSGVAGATTPVNGRSDGGAGASRKCRGERSPGTASADCAQCLSVIEAGAPPIMSQGSPDGITATLPCVLSARNVAQPIAATAAWANASDARAASAMRRKWRAVNMRPFYASKLSVDAKSREEFRWRMPGNRWETMPAADRLRRITCTNGVRGMARRNFTSPRALLRPLNQSSSRSHSRCASSSNR